MIQPVTVNDVIYNNNRSSYTLRNFYNTMTISNETKDDFFKIPIEDFFINHLSDFDELTEDYILSENYFYKPKSVSKILYGTTEFWLSILRLNGMKNITEFHIPLVRVYAPRVITEYINIFFKREGKR